MQQLSLKKKCLKTIYSKVQIDKIVQHKTTFYFDDTNMLAASKQVESFGIIYVKLCPWYTSLQIKR